MVAVTTFAINAEDVAAQAIKQARPQRAKIIRDQDLPYPPTLPRDAAFVTDKSPVFLQRPETLHEDVAVAKTPPQIDFLFYPEQTYPGKPWSNWGGGCVADGKYFSAIGDHYAIGRGASPHSTGNAFVYQYDPANKQLRTLADLASTLKLPADHYRPGKIHSRVDMGSDGWLYYATHRGSPKAASDANHYQGDWILRTNPTSGQSEVVAHGPIPKHSIPNSLLDPQRMIFYGGTAAGPDAASQEIHFFAYDLANRKLLYAGPNGPALHDLVQQHRLPVLRSGQ